MKRTKIVKYIIIGGCVIVATVFLIGVAGQFQPAQPTEMKSLTLKDYPELFSKDVIIIVGESATKVEREAVVTIKENLKELTGNQPIVKNDIELSELDKRTYNLILVGTPTTNNLLQDVYELTEATKVTDEYPGENKGIIEILRNPWNSKKALLIVAGSDVGGIKAGSIKLLKELTLQKKMVVVEWKENLLTRGTDEDVATGVGSGLVEKLTLEQLATQADYIVVGTVTNIISQRDVENKSIYTLVGLSIEQGIKGNLDQEEITIRVLGGEVDGLGLRVEDVPSFQLGERVVVFLEEREDDSFSVVGGFQGKFNVHENNMISDNTSLTEFIAQIRDILRKQ